MRLCWHAAAATHRRARGRGRAITAARHSRHVRRPLVPAQYSIESRNYHEEVRDYDRDGDLDAQNTNT